MRRAQYYALLVVLEPSLGMGASNVFLRPALKQIPGNGLWNGSLDAVSGTGPGIVPGSGPWNVLLELQ